MAIVTRKGTTKGILHLHKRVPKRYASVEHRKFVWASLHTDSRSTAEQKAAAMWTKWSRRGKRNLQVTRPTQKHALKQRAI
nr:DUF6538 domain-containing protein [Rhodobacter aestuarii]